MRISALFTRLARLIRRIAATPDAPPRLFNVHPSLQSLRVRRAVVLLPAFGCLVLPGLASAQTPGEAPQLEESSATGMQAQRNIATYAPSETNLPDAPGFSPSAIGDPQQTTAPATPVSAPHAPQTVPDGQQDVPGGQTKRILGIIPNYRSVSADQHLPPQTVKDKFVSAGHDSFDYGSFVLAAVQAGVSISGNSYPEFGKGVLGYGRYYWRTLLDTADENFMVGGVFPAVLHQDSRFYTLGHGSIPHRILYASTRVLITRGDNGSEEPNFSEILGAGAASGISSTYYPARYRTWTKVGQKWLTGVIIDGANFTFKEFWPDINRHYVSRVYHPKDKGGSGE